MQETKVRLRRPLESDCRSDDLQLPVPKRSGNLPRADGDQFVTRRDLSLLLEPSAVACYPIRPLHSTRQHRAADPSA